MLEITNMMNKEDALKLSKDVVNIFNTNSDWTPVYNTTKVNDDKTVDMLIVLESTNTIYKPIAINFCVNEHSILSTKVY